MKHAKEGGLIPDYVPNEEFQNSTTLEIKYPGDVVVSEGTVIEKAVSKNLPTVTFKAPDESALYTLLNIDPDAPTRNYAFLGPIRHWAVINIPGSSGDASKGIELTKYAGAGPPPFSGLHRYVYLLYKQPGTLEENVLNDAGRMRWDYKEFIERNKLELVSCDLYYAKF